MIRQKMVEEAVCRLFKEAVIKLPDDVKKALKTAYDLEEDETALLNLKAILDNVDAAENGGIPLCQDTGLPIIFVKYGKVEVENNHEGIVNGINGVKRGTEEIPLRPNVVDPLTRRNTGNNIGRFIPQIDVELVNTDSLEITVFLKVLVLKTIMHLKWLFQEKVKMVLKILYWKLYYLLEVNHALQWW